LWIFLTEAFGGQFTGLGARFSSTDTIGQYKAGTFVLQQVSSGW
jgi:hypothetical protein